MPEIDIRQPDNFLLSGAELPIEALWSYIIAPGTTASDAVRRKEFMAWRYLQLRGIGEEIRDADRPSSPMWKPAAQLAIDYVDNEYLKPLGGTAAGLRGHADIIKELPSRQWRTVAQMMCLLWGMHGSPAPIHGAPSLNKARYLVCRLTTPQDLIHNEKDAKLAWGQFRGVAHLALGLIRVMPPDCEPRSLRELFLRLRTALAAQNVIDTFQAKGTPIVPAVEMWRISDSFASDIMHHTACENVLAPELGDEAISLLALYRAPA